MAPTGPYKLVTCNTVPERAKLLIGRVVEDVKEKYTIIHAGNAEGKIPYSPLSPTQLLNSETQASTPSRQ